MSDELSQEVESEIVNEVADDPIVDDVNDDVEIAPEEDDEIDVDGKKFLLPKSAAEKLKAERLMHADYTRKTQELALERNNIAQERERVAQEIENNRSDLQDYARLTATEDKLKEFEQVNWNDLSNQDPVLAQQLWFQFTQLKEARNVTIQNLNTKAQQRQFEAQQANAKQLQEGNAVLSREIPNWSPELASKLLDYAVSEGWSKKEIESITPAQVKSLHRSYVGDQLLKKQNPSSKNVAQAKPITKVGSNAAVSKSPERMTDKEFAAMRRMQIKNRNN